MHTSDDYHYVLDKFLISRWDINSVYVLWNMEYFWVSFLDKSSNYYAPLMCGISKLKDTVYFIKRKQ